MEVRNVQKKIETAIFEKSIIYTILDYYEDES